MDLLRWFRRPDRVPEVVGAIGEVVAVGREIASTMRQASAVPAEDPALAAQLVHLGSLLKSLVGRVDEMERTRALWEANTEASLIRALEDHKAARRSEERERAQRGKKKRDDDEEGTLGTLVPEAVGGVSEAPQLQSMPTPVADRHRSRREAARAAKWGMSG